MIIGISGKKNSGKDLVGDIIQYLTFPLYRFQPKNLPKYNTPEDYIGKSSYFKDIKPIENWTKEELFNDSHFLKGIKEFDLKIKKFADKLKDIVCLLISCTREQLEDEDFNGTELGEEWWKYEIFDRFYKDWMPTTSYFYNKHHNNRDAEFRIIKPTLRFLLQNIDDLFKNHLHSDILVNSLMIEYRPLNIEKRSSMGNVLDYSDCVFPNWVITDLRFPNELKAIKDRNGICIRVNRDSEQLEYEYESETALDNSEFDYVIENNGTIEELIEKVREILIKEQII